ncbi:hypothetical protein [Staphylococcus sp. 11261D007BR]
MSRSERRAKIVFQILANRELSAENPAFGTPLIGFPEHYMSPSSLPLIFYITLVVI